MIHNYKYTENAFLPKTVTIPLVQEKNNLCKPVIKIGEIVEEGQIIASSSNSVIHSPIPGTVKDLRSVHNPDGKIEKALIIDFKGSFSYLGKKRTPEEWQSLSAATIERKLDDKGIVNIFSTTKSEPITEQIKAILRKKTRTLIVRLFDEDTRRFADTLMTHFYFDQIKEGAKILAKIIDAEGIIFVLSSKDIKARKLENDEKQNIYYMGVDTKKFTNGFKYEITELYNKTLRKTCRLSVSRKDFFVDSYTLFDIYNAVVFNEPVLSRHVHFTGNCIPASCFLNVRLGFTLRDVVKQLGAFIKNPSAVIINGRLCGNSVNTLDIPITKYVKSVEFLSKDNTTDSQVYSCIKCGMCRFKCPVGIAPDILYDYVLKHQEIPEALLQTATLCINCGLCNTVCQARIPLCQVITMIKNKLDKDDE